MKHTASPIVTVLNINDVLLRQPTTDVQSPGNIRFRKLVARRRGAYRATTNPEVRNTIALDVINEVARVKGRFLRKVESIEEARDLKIPKGVTAFVFVDGDTILSKVKRALEIDPLTTPPLALSRLVVASPSVVLSHSHSVPSKTAARGIIRAPNHPRSARVFESGNHRMAASTPFRKCPPSVVFPPSTKSSSDACWKSSNFEDREGGDEEEKINLRKRKLTSCSGARCDDAIVSGTDHGSSKKKIKTVHIGPITTTGDWAIREGFNRCVEQSRLPQAGGSASDDDDDDAAYLGLSLIETHVLKVACSHGLPVYTNIRLEDTFYSRSPTGRTGGDGTYKEDDNDENRFLYSWSDFGSLLLQAAKDWYNLQRARSSASEDFKGLGAGYGTTKLAVALAARPHRLAQRTIMLMERVRQLFMSRENTCANPTGVETWFSKDLGRWASALDVNDEQGQPVAYSAADFISEYPLEQQNDNIKAVCLFDAKAAQGVFTQVAHLTRLRSVFLEFSAPACDVDSSVQNALITTSLTSTNRESDVTIWKNGPVFWGLKGVPFHDDILLLGRLLINGYLGILENGGGYSFSSGVSQELVSMRSFGLTRGALQERAQQLTVILHIKSIEQLIVRRHVVMKEQIGHYLVDTCKKGHLERYGPT